MRYLKYLLILCVAPAFAFAIGTWKASETHGAGSPVTGTSPTTGPVTPNATNHLRHWTAKKIRVGVCTSAAETLSGGGSLNSWDLSSETGLWGRAPLSDLSLAQCGGTRCCYFDLDNVLGGGGWATWIPSAVTHSGAAGVTVTMEAVSQ